MNLDIETCNQDRSEDLTDSGFEPTKKPFNYKYLEVPDAGAMLYLQLLNQPKI